MTKEEAITMAEELNEEFYRLFGNNPPTPTLARVIKLIEWVLSTKK